MFLIVVSILMVNCKTAEIDKKSEAYLEERDKKFEEMYQYYQNGNR